MRQQYSKEVEQGRHLSGDYGTPPGCNHGVFRLICPLTQTRLKVIVSGEEAWLEEGYALPAWEHISVSLPNRTPTWEEMCWIKEQFFTDEECVVEYHPPRSTYVNVHQYVLHLWRVVGVSFPMPPVECV